MPSAPKRFAPPRPQGVKILPTAKDQERSKKKTNPFYNSPEWREFRRGVIRERGYRCATPGCTKRGTHLDHRQTIIVNPARRLDRTNVDVYCHSCHSRKTAKHDGGFGNPIRTNEETRSTQPPTYPSATGNAPQRASEASCVAIAV